MICLPPLGSGPEVHEAPEAQSCSPTQESPVGPSCGISEAGGLEALEVWGPFSVDI